MMTLNKLIKNLIGVNKIMIKMQIYSIELI